MKSVEKNHPKECKVIEINQNIVFLSNCILVYPNQIIEIRAYANQYKYRN